MSWTTPAFPVPGKQLYLIEKISLLFVVRSFLNNHFPDLGFIAIREWKRTNIYGIVGFFLPKYLNYLNT